MQEIEFSGKKRYLSNMYKCEIETREDMNFGIDLPTHLWQSSEHIYQFFKSKDKRWQLRILNETEPKVTKNMASKFIPDTYKLSNEWDSNMKKYVMRIALYLKFSQNEELYSRLKKEVGPIIEKNYWGDVFWGECKGRGMNFLGKYLMEIRDTGLEVYKNNLKNYN